MTAIRGRARGIRVPDLGSRGEGWVALQAILFVAVIASGLAGPMWDGPGRATSMLGGLALGTGGFALIVGGILGLRRQLTAFPRPVAGGRLIEGGAFGLVRHPMYGGGVLFAVGWGLLAASVPTLALALVLALFFDLKSRREETWLAEAFAGYADYRRRTPRLIPWLYRPGTSVTSGARSRRGVPPGREADGTALRPPGARSLRTRRGERSSRSARSPAGGAGHHQACTCGSPMA